MKRKGAGLLEMGIYKFEIITKASKTENIFDHRSLWQNDNVLKQAKSFKIIKPSSASNLPVGWYSAKHICIVDEGCIKKLLAQIKGRRRVGGRRDRQEYYSD